MAMTKSARKPAAVRPSWWWFALLDGGILALVIFSASDGAHRAVAEASPTPLPPQRVLRRMLAGTALIHIAEAVFAARGARRRGLRAGSWARQTFVVGFPSLIALRRVPVPAE
jgi:Domain of unknown function (DUF4499)